MKILVIGQGGREHALAWKLSQSKKSEIVFVAPGNGGTSTEEKCLNVSIKVNDFPGIKKFVIEEQIELVVIGPEDPLVNGLVDYLQDLNLSQPHHQLHILRHVEKDSLFQGLHLNMDLIFLFLL